MPIERVPVTTPDEMMVDLLARLDETQPPRALVREGGGIVGVVTPEDLARAIRAGQLRASQPGDTAGVDRPAADRGTSEGPVLP